MANKEISPAVRKLELARHKNRPVLYDYLPLIFDEWMGFQGDRCFREDPAIWGGLALLAGRPVTVIGHAKGKNTRQNIDRNFGMPHPEGYRKALRLMKQAEKFKRPVICFVDTPGAYCGIGAEERGQGEAIARNLLAMSTLRTAILSVFTGEGGSGGALALAVADRLYMLENAVYSVISPKGFASILWKDPSREWEAAEKLKMTAQDLLQFGVMDEIIAEPENGAHKDHAATAASIREALLSGLVWTDSLSTEALLQKRYEKFRKMGVFDEISS